MAQSGYTTIQLFNSTTSGHAPTASQLVAGELALNSADGKIYYLSTSGTVSAFTGGSGTSGVSGASGYSGYSGYSGATGTGTSGYSGYSGENGAAASSGYSGISGYSGFSGYSGSSISGYSGAGTSGFSGYSGYSGASSGSIIGTNNNFTGVNNFAQTVSIGTTSALGPLYVVGANSNILTLDNTGQQYTTFSLYNNGTEKANLFWDNTNTRMVLGTDVSAALAFKTATVNRMQISSAGGVSIGTTTDPGNQNLLVNGTVQANTFIGAGTNLTGTASSLSVGYASSAGSASSASTATTANGLSGSPSITVSGVTSSGTVQAFSGANYSALQGGSVALYNGNTGMYADGSKFGFQSNGTSMCFIYNGTGSIQNISGSYTAISDNRIKENITPARSYLTDLQKLNVVNYNLIGKTEKYLGLVAQDVQAVMPGLVDTEATNDVFPDVPNLLSVKYSILVPMLLQAVQELSAKVDAQAVEIAALKGA